MNLYFISIAMTIIANVSYHLCMKGTSPNIHPLVSLTISYLVAAVTCLVCIPMMVSGSLPEQFRSLNWASVALGVSIVGLEVGFILAYRAGWNLSQAAVYSNVAVGLLLLPIGILFFKERVTTTNLVGLATAMVGLYLLGKK